VFVQPDGAALLTNGQTQARFAIAPGAASDTLRLGPPKPVPAEPGDRIVAWNRWGPQFLDRPVLEACRDVPAGARLYEAFATQDGHWAAASVVVRSPLPSNKIPWGAESVIAVWDRKAPDRVWAFPAPERTYLAFSPDGRWLAGRSEHELRVWRTGTWEVHVMPEDGGANSAFFSDDGRVMGVALPPERVRLRETDTWKELVALESAQPFAGANGALSADGTRLAMSSEGWVRLWDLRAVREGLAALGLDWSGNGAGSTVADHGTAGWGPPRLLHLEQNVADHNQEMNHRSPRP
jgi:hypothetical protein